MKKLLSIAIVLGALACKTDKKKETQEEENSYTIPSDKASAKKTPLDESIARGKKVYSELCVTCHLPTGKGIPRTYPPLDGSNWLTEKRMESIRGVKYGLQGPITVNGKEYDNVMTPMGLNDQEVADALNYAMNSWSNNIDDMVTAEEVAGVEKAE